MNLDIKSHYWPLTPKTREIKIIYDEELIISIFMNKEKIFDLAKKLIDIAHEIH